MERLTTGRDYEVDKGAYERHLKQGYPRNMARERFLRLCEYERTDLTPKQIQEMSDAFLAKREEVNRLTAELEELKKQPQGDLISRSALMEDIRNTITEQSSTIDWLNLINKQPTAYDVDAVVEKLEEVKTLHEELSTSEKLSSNDKYNHTLLHGLCVKAIEIVRGGGK